MSADFYFSKWEMRRPPPPQAWSRKQEFWWQALAVAAGVLGIWYLAWRWSASLNPDAFWLSVPVVVAETLCYVGLLLFFHNIWQVRDTPQQAPPSSRDVCIPGGDSRLLSVDIFITTYNEDPELVRLSIIDAKRVRYPVPIDLKVFVLDDGRRAEMAAVTAEEVANYVARSNNEGYKAGNLRNAMSATAGDFIVICDADTRLFPSFLENTMGYFRDPDVAWVQTPQWFYDVAEGERLTTWLCRRAGDVAGRAGDLVERLVGPVRIGRDPFGCDPKLFYDVILRRRNAVGASFCCGAGSVHRREAILDGALRGYARQVDAGTSAAVRWVLSPKRRAELERAPRRDLSRKIGITPYKFHVSEDIYTSILLHGDRDRNWKSVLHPTVEARMLSPQDLLSWATQRFKYAGGTLDIMLRDNPLFRAGMTLRQKLMYASTFWSYFSPFWVVIFLAAPLVSLFTGISPVEAYSSDFFLHLLPFLIIHELALIIGMWGIDNRDGRLISIAFFWLNIKAMWTVIRGREIRFHVTPKTRQSGRYLSVVAPHILIIALTVAALVTGVMRYVDNPGNEALGLLAVNAFWAGCNAIALSILVCAAFWRPPEEDASADESAKMAAGADATVTA